MQILKTSTALVTLVTLSTAPAIAAGWLFVDLDADKSQELSGTEFEQVSRDRFAAWDMDQDDRISSDEFYRGLYSDWDRDNDNRLNENEYQRGMESRFGDDEAPSFESVDTNSDGMIGEDEFASELGESDLFNAEEGADWAAFHRELFAAYDRDATNSLTETEYAEFGVIDPGTETDSPQTTGAIASNTLQADEIIALPDWHVAEFYADGLSVDRMIDDMEVRGVEGDEIGSIEDVIFAPDGRALSIIAEVGGFWDMFDTHVNVPWDQVTVEADRITIPVNEENVDDYAFKDDYLTAEDAGENIQAVQEDLLTGPRAFRASELIGDYSRIRDVDGFAPYGYVNDLIIQNGELKAVVVDPGTAWGPTGPYAYPYYGYGYGWAPGSPYYDMPYDRGEVADADAVDYDRLGTEQR